MCGITKFLLSTVRADQDLFDLISAGSGFLTLAKSHPISSQYWENYEEITLTNDDVRFLSYSVIRAANPRGQNVLKTKVERVKLVEMTEARRNKSRAAVDD
jgi:hypothetical protein